MADRLAWDQALRRSLVNDLGTVRGRLATAGAAEARKGQLKTVAQIEGLIALVGRVVDRVETAAFVYGPWVSRVQTMEVPLALRPLDEQVRSLSVELLDSVTSLGPDPVLAWRVDLLTALVEELAHAFATRQEVLAAPDAPPRDADGPALATWAPGRRVVLLGDLYAVSARTRWRRGDTSLVLVGPGPERVLWQEGGTARDRGALVLFEAQALALPADPAQPWVVDGVSFSLMWHDDWGGLETGPAGRREVASRRWLFGSPDGVLAWLERRGDAVLTRRGVGLTADEWQSVEL